jgi:hypothetical protein
MRKFITAGMAVAMLAIPAAASASVNVNDAGVGTVGKGDVQSVLGFNDAEMQTAWKDGKVKFTTLYQMDSIDRWNCSDGSVQQMTLRTVQAKPLNVIANTNKAGKLTSGWDLNGVSTIGGTFVRGERIGYDKMYQCPGGYLTGFAPHLFENTILPGISVNGTSLPNTPVEVA